MFGVIGGKMSVYDCLVGCVPINKKTGVVVSISTEGLELTPREQRIKSIKEEIAQIDKCLSSIKNVNYIGTKERNEIVAKKYDLTNTLKQLKAKQLEIKNTAFEVVFMRIAKEFLSEENYKEIYNKTMYVISEIRKPIKEEK